MRHLLVSWKASDSWSRFWQNRPARISMFVLIFWVVIAVLAPLLANEKPLYVFINGKHLFPAFSGTPPDELLWSDRPSSAAGDSAKMKWAGAQRVLWAPIPYDPLRSDWQLREQVGPFDFQYRTDDKMLPLRQRHWLGTGIRGDDVLAGIIHGARTSLWLGIVSVGLATLIGLCIGAVSGYFGDRRLRLSRSAICGLITGLVACGYYVGVMGVQAWTAWFDEQTIMSNQTIFALLLIFTIFGLAGGVYRLLLLIPWMRQPVAVPIDLILSRLTETLLSIPLLMVFITIAALTKPSLWTVILIIGFTGWPGIARLVRAEMIRLREMEFIQAARLLGLTDIQVLIRHAIPNAMTPVLVSISFGIGNVILAESALSFLGVGMPADVVSWGAMISAGKSNLEAWWVLVFPGVCILMVVVCFNFVGEGLRDALDPRMDRPLRPFAV